MIVIQNPRIRRVLGAALPFGVIPALVAGGVFLWGQKYYALTALMVAAAALLLFITGFEQKKTGARRLVVTAVLTALSVAGRFIPLFKPVAAMSILTGMTLGGEAGFLVGALSALLSNFYFGQGPWTPFQMLAWGAVGLFAGLLKRPLSASRALLLVYGALSGVFFSFLMDVWTVLWYAGGWSPAAYAAALASALPHTALYAVTNVAFLFLFAPSFTRKMNRLCRKYEL